MFDTQEAQVIPPTWMKHLEYVASLSGFLDLTGVTLEDPDSTGSDAGTRELVSVHKKGSLVAAKVSFRLSELL